ncbi:DUF2345 domain-containing protein, partial [Paraburkholderia bannensis]|uniref:DUF2345 domain-containing protein n=1 Tax=Paraburkholderia bannensis TaxID=765414 RepID=UPI002AC3523E
EKIPLFVQQAGIKIFAAKGPVEFQAQGGPISLTAAKDVNCASVNSKVNLAAAKEIILECGGAFVQIKDGSITLGGPGDLFLKTITVQKQGKASQGPRLPVLPSGKVGDLPHFLELSHHYEDLQPVKNAPYTVRLKNGTTLSGTLDDRGFARIDGMQPGQGTASLGEDVRQWASEPQRPNKYSGVASDAPSGINLVRTFLS